MDSQDIVMNFSVEKVQNLLQKKEISAHFLTEIYLNRISQEKENAYLYVNEQALKQADLIDTKRLMGEKLSNLAGIPIVIKDNIAVKGMPCTCASKLLESFISPYNATVTEKLSDTVLLGKTNMDEFAMGSDGKNSYFGTVYHPINKAYTAGGSSSGSAAAVGAKTAPLALGSDTGGSIRLPAAFCGIVGFKPSYGRVSRYGLTAFASSFDQIGPMANSVNDCKILYQAISGKDDKDATSVDFLKENKPFDKKSLKVGLVKEYFEAVIDSEIKDTIVDFANKLPGETVTIEECSLPSAALAIQGYYLLSSAEAAANLARFDGMRYGYKAHGENYKEMFAKSRGEGLGYEVKKRILLGNYILQQGYYEQYYRQALYLQAKIKAEFSQLFQKYDCLLAPTTVVAGIQTDKKQDALELYRQDICTVGVSIAQLPALTLPVGKTRQHLPVGMQIIGAYGSDEKVLEIGQFMEEYREELSNSSRI